MGYPPRVPPVPRPRRAAGLAHEVAGTGPALVLVHGLGSSRRAFDRLVPRLVDRWTTIAVDLPGHGDSPRLPPRAVTPRRLAAVLGEFLDVLGLDRADLVGNSLGGWTVLEAAVDGRARSVVGLCPAGLWDPPMRRRGPLVSANRAIARVARPVLPVLLSAAPVRRAGFASAVARPELLDRATAVQAARDQADADGFDAAFDGLLGVSFDRGAALPESVPVTVAFGDRDHILPGPRMQNRGMLPTHARWVVLDRCGHAPMWDDVASTVRLIDETAAAAGATAHAPAPAHAGPTSVTGGPPR